MSAPLSLNSNDTLIQAPGPRALYEAMLLLEEVVVMAPEVECSAVFSVDYWEGVPILAQPRPSPTTVQAEAWGTG